MYTYPQYQILAQQLYASQVPENMNCIVEPSDGRGGLYLGDYVSTMRTDLLIQYSIGAILSAAIQSKYNKTYDPRTQNIVGKHILAYDIYHYDISQHFEECTEWIEYCLAQGVSVLVHCRAGISRSATIVMAYLMKKFGFSFEQAYTYVKARRSIVEPNDGFKNCLRQYESALIAATAARSSQVSNPLLYSVEQTLNSSILNQNLKRSSVRPTSSYRKSKVLNNGMVVVEQNPEVLLSMSSVQPEIDLRKSIVLSTSQPTMMTDRYYQQQMAAQTNAMMYQYPAAQQQRVAYQQPMFVQTQPLYQSYAYQPVIQAQPQSQQAYMQYYAPQAVAGWY